MDKKYFLLSAKDTKVEKDGTGQAIFATLNVVDKDGDVTLPGAFGSQETHLVGAHQGQNPAVGKSAISEKGDRAVADIRFNLEISAARDWHSALKFDLDPKNGTPQYEWSYGFNVVDFETGVFEGRDVRFLKKLDVIEVSPVLRGAGEGTRTLSLKSEIVNAEPGVSEGRSVRFLKKLDVVEVSLMAAIKEVEDKYPDLTISEISEKEGRVLSGRNRERLTRLQNLLTEVGKDVEKLLEVSDPDAGKSKESELDEKAVEELVALAVARTIETQARIRNELG